MNTPKHHIPESVKKLLHNPYFILWYYAPTEESEKAWAGWMEKHPEKEQDILEAKNILHATKLNKRFLSETDSSRLLNRIQTGIALRRKKKQQKRALFRIVAACVILICTLGPLLYFQMNDKPVIIYATKNPVRLDSTQTEVELEFTNREKILVANKSTIEFDKTGAVHIHKDKATTVVSESTKDKRELAQTAVMNTLKVPAGRHTAIKLPDGSAVWVNSGTILQFPDSFEEDNRTIYANGEIYLEVTKDPSRPFYVKTSQIDIRVLGTCFNVTAYSDEEHQSVVLAEGGVEVQTKNGMKQRIRPDERLVWENNRISVSQVDTYDYISWKDGIFLFNNQNLSYVVHRLSRYYRKQIICDPDIAGQTCTGKLVLFDDFNKVLHTLEESLHISYELKGDTIKLSNNLKN